MQNLGRMTRRTAARWLAAAFLGLAIVGAARATDALSPALEDLRRAQGLPGLAGIVMRDGEWLAQGQAGVRRLGEPAAITLADRFAIGSCTKRMTAFMVARLAERGRLSLDARLGEVLADLPMRDEYRAVTLAQLLDFTGGIAGYERIGPRITPELFDTTGTPAERELRFARHVLGLPPAGAIGREAVYSNASYLLAALMASRLAGRDYASLMAEEVFGPLGMASAGWGRPWSPDRPDQPWLHEDHPGGHRPEPDAVRPPEELFRAAGNAHMSVPDLARFAQADLLATTGRSPLLQRSELWRRIDGPGPPAGGPAIVAGGTPWLSACYAVWPEQRLVAAVAVNGGTPDDAACRAFVRLVADRYGPKPGRP